jgi:hypothetical protein
MRLLVKTLHNVMLALATKIWVATQSTLSMTGQASVTTRFNARLSTRPDVLLEQCRRQRNSTAVFQRHSRSGTLLVQRVTACSFTKKSRVFWGDCAHSSVRPFSQATLPSSSNQMRSLRASQTRERMRRLGPCAPLSVADARPKHR